MAPSRPPAAPKRPWWLFAALVAGWIYGAQALSEGYDTIAYFRGDPVDVHALADEVNDPARRAEVITLGDRWIAAKERTKSREYPLGIASLLLGGAMILFAARSMAGREGARSALVQVVVVHAGLVVAWAWLSADANRAFFAFEETRQLAIGGTPYGPDWQRVLAIAEKIAPIIAVGMRTMASALIVIALTRPRARAYFESVPPQLGEG